MTTCYPDSMKVKRDIQRRIEDHVIKYCETLEENFKQYSIDSYKRNIENPSSVTEGYKSYYEEQYREQGKNKDDVDIIKFRKECREFAEKWIDIQREEFIRLGINGDW